MTSPGPALYGGMRVGLRGQEFYIHKFRTLRANSATPGLDTIRSGDPRITTLGKILREWYFDELIQLWDVFLGHMSLVGPRPYTRPDAEYREALFARFRKREEIMPGMTGLAQVSLGRDRSKNNLCRTLNYDLYYIRHISPCLDLYILFRTIIVILTRRGE
jgi:lipopolysaccharide/colanic/teichoic acid biosynthesis glycosyltransferase